MVDFFEHSEREVVETVCLVSYPLISLMRDQVSSFNERGIKAGDLGPESSDTETEDAFEGKYNLVFTKSVRFQVGFNLNTDRRFKAASWTLEIKNGNMQYYFEA